MPSSLPMKTLLFIVNSKRKLGFVAVFLFFIILFKSDVFNLMILFDSWQVSCDGIVYNWQADKMFSNEIIIPENMNRYTQAFILNKECISLFL